MSTMPGPPLYEAYRFRVLDRVGIRMPVETTIAGASIEKPIP